jgi:hypothetical protein
MGAFSDAEKNRMLDAHAGRTAMAANAGFYIKLHLGSPGAAGTTNPAAETTRKAVTFGAAAAAGAISNTVAVSWTAYPNAESLTHVSFWDAAAAGSFLGADDLPVTKVMQIGDTLTIAIGDLDLTITGALP